MGGGATTCPLASVSTGTSGSGRSMDLCCAHSKKPAVFTLRLAANHAATSSYWVASTIDGTSLAFAPRYSSHVHPAAAHEAVGANSGFASPPEE